MSKVSIIDYGLGNIYSLLSAFRYLGIDSSLISSPSEVSASSHLVLPGVGAFPAAMNRLHKSNLVDAIKSHHFSGKPMLGICLGMQLLFTRGFEVSECIGLQLLKGDIIRIDSFSELSSNIILPNVGWRDISVPSSPLLDIKDNASFYFVHSYMASNFTSDSVLYSNYSEIQIPSLVASGNTFGVQFHPEKSGTCGLKLLSHFASISY